MTKDIYSILGYILNGPTIFVIVIVGCFLNAIAIYILSNANFLLTSTNASFRRKSTHRKSIKGSPSSKPLIQNHAELWQRHFKEKQQKARNAKKPRIYTYLLWLTSCDMVLLLLSFMNFSVPTLTDWLNGPYAKLVPVWYVLSNATFTANVWLMISLVRDRYTRLCSGFAESVSSQTEKPKVIHLTLFFLCLIAIFLSTPRFFELSVYYSEIYHQYIVTSTSLVQNQFYMLGYRIVGSLLFYSALPYVYIIVTSFQIWLVLSNASKIRSTMNVSSSSSSHKIFSDSDRLLLALSVKFLISRLPTTLLDILENLLGSNQFFESPIVLLIVYISNIIVVLSSATTFLTFLIFSPKFYSSVKSFFKAQAVFL